MVTKVLIVGNTGFLGTSLVSSIADGDFSIDSVGRNQVDLSKPIPSEFKKLLAAQAYTYAVICSAITDVEKCFKNQAESQQINVTGTIQLLNTLKAYRIVPVFFSSDYVFRPSESAHEEDDERTPQTCYGQQKLAVEEYLEKNFERFLIFRTSKLMSKTPHAKNILLPVIQNLKNGVETKCFLDQWLNPVFVEDISKVLELSFRQGLNGKFHLGTRQIFTRFEIGKLLAEILGQNSNLIQPMSMQDISFSEPRPTHNTLNCRKIERVLNFKFTEIVDVAEQLMLLQNH